MLIKVILVCDFAGPDSTDLDSKEIGRSTIKRSGQYITRHGREQSPFVE